MGKLCVNGARQRNLQMNVEELKRTASNINSMSALTIDTGRRTECGNFVSERIKSSKLRVFYSQLLWSMYRSNAASTIRKQASNKSPLLLRH
jgi:hypothetical protein